jgi:hypothetical protein
VLLAASQEELRSIKLVSYNGFLPFPSQFVFQNHPPILRSVTPDAAKTLNELRNSLSEADSETRLPSVRVEKIRFPKIASDASRMHSIVF